MYFLSFDRFFNQPLISPRADPKTLPKNDLSHSVFIKWKENFNSGGASTLQSYSRQQNLCYPGLNPADDIETTINNDNEKQTCIKYENHQNFDRRFGTLHVDELPTKKG
jgi:hypothetical protein